MAGQSGSQSNLVVKEKELQGQRGYSWVGAELQQQCQQAQER